MCITGSNCTKKMTVLTLLVAVFLGIAGLSAQTPREGENFGVGIILGEPTGISLKFIASRTNALDFAAGWNLRYENLYLHADYLLNFYQIAVEPEIQFPVYTGIGAKLDINNTDLGIGLRIPVGVSYTFASTPLELFLEIVPTVMLIPATDFDFGAGLGIRYYF